MATKDVHQYLLDRLHSLPQANSIALIDDQGVIVNFSHTWPIPHIDASDRDFFRYLRDHRDSGAVIGAPVTNRFTGASTIMLARRVDAPDGTFIGVVAGVIEARYFVDFYNAVTRADKGRSVSLVRSDGTFLARHPVAERTIGSKITTDSPLYVNIAAGGGTYRTPGYVDGQPRIVSVQPIRDYPLAVSVGITEDEALAPWRRKAIIIGIGTAWAIIGFTVLFKVLAAQLGHSRRVRSRLAQSEGQDFRDFASSRPTGSGDRRGPSLYLYFRRHPRLWRRGRRTASAAAAWRWRSIPAARRRSGARHLDLLRRKLEPFSRFHLFAARR